MSKQYQNPPVVEALCEFRFAKDCISDPAIPGLLYSKKNISDHFPIRDKRIVQELKIHQEKDQQLIQEVMITSWAMFLSEDRLALIQVSPSLLSVNVLRPYPTWQSFQPMILNVFNELTELVKQPTI